MWLIVLFVLASLGAFGWLAYKDGFSAAWKAVVALAAAIAAAFLTFGQNF